MNGNGNVYVEATNITSNDPLVPVFALVRTDQGGVITEYNLTFVGDSVSFNLNAGDTIDIIAASGDPAPNLFGGSFSGFFEAFAGGSAGQGGDGGDGGNATANGTNSTANGGDGGDAGQASAFGGAFGTGEATGVGSSSTNGTAGINT